MVELRLLYQLAAHQALLLAMADRSTLSPAALANMADPVPLRHLSMPCLRLIPMGQIAPSPARVQGPFLVVPYNRRTGEECPQTAAGVCSRCLWSPVWALDSPWLLARVA